ncbi:hypothetical protein K432DRAFT_358654 [Lepidopterella palustris CBS 459.81]|uniref:Uncharacterized protein n=1 Tax=Lepidopterella palustris CBS 459.81 TaxID=1314670 RepID=A0A8E2E4T7_9PEZI|nr:hypothetical protein K432DRAFT_358654 [Lepidopterella palustris CBS 459.81]
MARASYAHPTAASLAKQFSQRSKDTKESNRTNTTELSTSGSNQRRPRGSGPTHHSIRTFNANGDHIDNGFVIKPARDKICHFAKLSPELRIKIYNHVLNVSHCLFVTSGYYDRTPLLGRLAWPTLLRVCRVIRHEASYEFYSKTTFKGIIYDNNFEGVYTWYERIPASSRVHLQRNRNLTLQFQLTEDPYHYISMLTWSPRGNRICWNETRLCGNLYEAPDHQRPIFVSISRLLKWFLWCAKPMHRNIPWRYQVVRRFWSPRGHCLCAEDLLDLFRQTLGMFIHRVKRYVRLSSEQKQLMAHEALNLLRELETLHTVNDIERSRRWEVGAALFRQWLADVESASK